LLCLQRFWGAALVMCFMVLCKEYYAIAAVAAAACFLLRRRYRLALLFTAPVLVGALWQLYLWLNFRAPAWRQSHGNFEWFLTGYWDLLWSGSMQEERLVILSILAMAAVWGLTLPRHRQDALVWVWGAFMVLNLTGGANRQEVAMVRIFSPAYMCYLLALLRYRHRLLLLPGLLMAAYTLLKIAGHWY
jgi:hypothetical protein